MAEKNTTENLIFFSPIVALNNGKCPEFITLTPTPIISYGD